MGVGEGVSCTCCCEGLLDTLDLALQSVVFVCECMHPLFQLAAVLLPQRYLRAHQTNLRQCQWHN